MGRYRGRSAPPCACVAKFPRTKEVFPRGFSPPSFLLFAAAFRSFDPSSPRRGPAYSSGFFGIAHEARDLIPRSALAAAPDGDEKSSVCRPAGADTAVFDQGCCWGLPRPPVSATLSSWASRAPLATRPLPLVLVAVSPFRIGMRRRASISGRKDRQDVRLSRSKT